MSSNPEYFKKPDPNLENATDDMYAEDDEVAFINEEINKGSLQEGVTVQRVPGIDEEDFYDTGQSPDESMDTPRPKLTANVFKAPESDSESEGEGELPPDSIPSYPRVFAQSHDDSDEKKRAEESHQLNSAKALAVLLRNLKADLAVAGTSSVKEIDILPTMVSKAGTQALAKKPEFIPAPDQIIKVSPDDNTESYIRKSLLAMNNAELVKHINAALKIPARNWLQYEPFNPALDRALSGITEAIEKGANPDQVDESGATLLMVLCDAHRDDIMEVLLKGSEMHHGADINIRDKQGFNVVMRVIQKGGVAMPTTLQTLLNAKFKPDVVLGALRSNGTYNQNKTPLKILELRQNALPPPYCLDDTTYRRLSGLLTALERQQRPDVENIIRQQEMTSRLGKPLPPKPPEGNPAPLLSLFDRMMMDWNMQEQNWSVLAPAVKGLVAALDAGFDPDQGKPKP